MNWNKLMRSTEQSYDPALHTKSKVDTFNATPGDLKDWDCPKCLNRGIIAHCRPDNTIGFSDCSCRKIRRSIRHMEQSGLKTSIQELTFDTFHAQAPWQIMVKKGAMEYAENGDGWFLICGQSGCGKTHLCTAICREWLLKEEEVRYISWRDEISALKAMSMDGDEQEKLLQELREVPVLYIDDLFKTGADDSGRRRPTPADITLTLRILDYRYRNNLRTILSTELQTKELLTVDEAVGGRILERAGKHVYTIKPAQSRNHRLRKVVSP